MRRWTLVAAGAAAGAILGVVSATASAREYRAHASFVVAPALQKTDPALRTLTATAAALVASPAVARNVVAALHLRESPEALERRIHAHARPGVAVVDVSADAASRVAAAQLVQQVLVAFQPLANARLGAGGATPAVQIWDTPANDAPARRRPVASHAAVGAVVGALLAAAAGALPRRDREEPPAPEPAAPVAPIEPEPELEPEPEPEPELEPEPEPDPELELEPEPEPVRAGLLGELERRAASTATAAEREERAAYVEYLAPFADADGNLPPRFLPLVEQVFGDVRP